MEEKEIKEFIFKNALEFYNFTEAQLYCANEILLTLNKEYQIHNSITNNIIIKSIQENYDFVGVTNKDISYTIKQLEEKFYFIEKHNEMNTYKITFDGQEMLQTNENFLKYLGKEIINLLTDLRENLRNRSQQYEINTLTIKDLQGSIFQAKYAWLFILANAVLTIIISVTAVYIIKRMGLG